MKNASRERSIGFPTPKNIDEVSYGSCTSGSYNGNAHGLADSRGQFAVEPCAHSIGVHGSEKDFTRAAQLRFARPLHHTAASVLASTLYEDLRVTNRVGRLRIAARIDSHDDSLRAEAAANGVNQGWIGERGRVHAHLVRTGLEDLR